MLCPPITSDIGVNNSDINISDVSIGAAGSSVIAPRYFYGVEPGADPLKFESQTFDSARFAALFVQYNNTEQYRTETYPYMMDEIMYQFAQVNKTLF